MAQNDHTDDALEDEPLSTEIVQRKPDQPLPIAGQDQSPLFTLPLEIRLQTYDYLLRRPCSDKFGDNFVVPMTRSPINPGSPTVLSILSTCRRAHNEAEHVFYASNLLWVDDVDFLKSLGPVRRNAISALAILGEAADMVLEAFKDAQGLANLRSLHLVRQITVKYINIERWVALEDQLHQQAEKLPQVEKFEIFAPDEVTELTRWEMAKKISLDTFDGVLRRAVRRDMSGLITYLMKTYLGSK